MLQAAIATLGAAGKVSDMDLDELESTDKKAKKKDKKKRTAAELEADIGKSVELHVAVDAICILLYAQDLRPMHRTGCFTAKPTAAFKAVESELHAHTI